jgi:hypothetical protein
MEKITIGEIYAKVLLNEEIDWNTICTKYELTEEFIREFQDKLTNKCWKYIAIYNKLNEAFIEEFKDKFNWYLINKHQVLSKEFLNKHKSDIYFDSNYTAVALYDRR